MKYLKLTDEVVLPVMEMHNITREEAEKRICLLFKSGILKTGSPDDPEWQRLIDGFLAQDSETLANTVVFEMLFTKCLENAALVREYDRLTYSNLTKALRKAKAGIPPKNFKRQLEGFEKFVRDTILPRLSQ